MTLATGERGYQFEALTDLWTGSITDKNGRIKEKPVSDRLITTGLLGSIRWWFEVLVRGLGGHACDPSDGDIRCPDKDRSHCAVCELFGYTGWARKFRFRILDEKSNIKTGQINTFSLRFTPLRPICNEEWALMDATLRLIAEYGAIGGKTVFKPTDETSRVYEKHHRDYGLLRIIQFPQVKRMERADLETYLSKWRKLDHDKFAWASLQHFWCVTGKYLARQNANICTFNRVIGRPEPKQQSAQNDSWIAGRRPDRKNNIDPESKKVFSFKRPARTFGFVNPNKKIEFDTIKQKLISVWGQNGWDYLTGDKIINQLFAGKEDRP